MLADLIGEVISSIVGDALVGVLSPDASKPKPPAPEEDWNASLGSRAAFLSSVAAMFCALSAFGVLHGARETLPWLFLGGSIVVAMLSGIMARRALEKTTRRRTLATLGLWVSRATIAAGLVAAVVSLTGVGLR